MKNKFHTTEDQINVGNYRIKFNRQDDLAPAVCAPLYYRFGEITKKIDAAEHCDMLVPIYQITEQRVASRKTNVDTKRVFSGMFGPRKKKGTAYLHKQKLSK